MCLGRGGENLRERTGGERNAFSHCFCLNKQCTVATGWEYKHHLQKTSRTKHKFYAKRRSPTETVVHLLRSLHLMPRIIRICPHSSGYKQQPKRPSILFPSDGPWTALQNGLFVILTSCPVNHSISALTHASCRGILNARQSWSFVFWQLLIAALYLSLK